MLRYCHVGTVFDAQLASAEEACVKERERCREGAEEHAETRAQASKLQVCSSNADELAGSCFYMLYVPVRRVSGWLLWIETGTANQNVIAWSPREILSLWATLFTCCK